MKATKELEQYVTVMEKLVVLFDKASKCKEDLEKEKTLCIQRGKEVMSRMRSLKEAKKPRPDSLLDEAMQVVADMDELIRKAKIIQYVFNDIEDMRKKVEARVQMITEK